jgi:FAD/FMN-containing dehydrogenase
VESYFYDKRVAFYFFGYDVARLLVGSKEQLAIVTQISFKVMPNTFA